MPYSSGLAKLISQENFPPGVDMAATTQRLLLGLGLAASLAACAGSPDGLGPGPKENTGTLLGAGCGALLGAAVAGGGTGNRLAGAAIGGLLGGLIGNRIGASLDDEDRQRAYAAQMSALEGGPSGAPVSWRNPDSGRYGTVVPGPAYVAGRAATAAPSRTPSISTARRRPRAAPPAAIPTAAGRRWAKSRRTWLIGC